MLARLAREVRTPLLRLLGLTDLSRWSDPRFYKHEARGRAALAASLIAPRSRVLDLGCGHMLLADTLPEGCAYTGADLVPFRPEVLRCDLNNGGEFPPGRYDYIVMLGVLVYLHHPERVLREARQRADWLVVCYTFAKQRGFRALRRRWRPGYVNNFDEAAFLGVLAAAGWQPQTSRTYHETPHSRHDLYLCTGR